MRSWLHDMRFGLRVLLSKPGFAAVAVVTLGLGIGANTAIFSLVQGIVLHPLPFADSDRLVQIWETAQRDTLELRSLSYPVVLDLNRDNDVFESVAGINRFTANVSGDTDSEPQRVLAESVSPNYFELLRLSPKMGRTFTPEEDGFDRLDLPVVISEQMWRTRFGAVPDVLGSAIRVNEVRGQVIGVLDGGGVQGDVDLWLPLKTTPLVVARVRASRYENRGTRWLDAVGRLKPGVAWDDVSQFMELETTRLQQDFPEDMPDRGVLAVRLEEQLFGDVQGTTLALMISVGLVMLIACGNLANLLLAQAVQRKREVALRLALGATRRRIIRQLLTESVLLGLLGGAVGLVLALWTQDLLQSLSLFEQLPTYLTFGLDPTTLGFTGLLSLVTACLFGVAPAAVAASEELSLAVKGSSSAPHSLLSSVNGRSLLVSAQIALALVLTVAAGLMFHSLRRQLLIDPGFVSEDLLTMRIQLPATRYDGDGAFRFGRELSSRLESLPGIHAAAISTDIPLVDGYSAFGITIEDRLTTAPGEQTRVYHHEVSPAYFSTLGVALVAGRDFNWFDTGEAPGVVIVSEKMARVGWPAENPLGKRVNLGGPKGDWLAVVGVVADIRYRDLVHDPASNPDDPDIYLPLSQAPSRSLGLVMSSSTSVEAVVRGAREQLHQLDAAIPLFGVSEMTDVVAAEVALSRWSSWLLGLFGGLALLLAALGIYGLLSHLVAQRTRDIGIRMALGAKRSDIRRQVVRQGFMMSLVGVLGGTLLSLGLGRYLESLLFEVSAGDLQTLIASGVLLTSVALATSYIAARRATELDPVRALKQN